MTPSDEQQAKTKLFREIVGFNPLDLKGMIDPKGRALLDVQLSQFGQIIVTSRDAAYVLRCKKVASQIVFTDKVGSRIQKSLTPYMGPQKQQLVVNFYEGELNEANIEYLTEYSQSRQQFLRGRDGGEASFALDKQGGEIKAHIENLLDTMMPGAGRALEQLRKGQDPLPQSDNITQSIQKILEDALGAEAIESFKPRYYTNCFGQSEDVFHENHASDIPNHVEIVVYSERTEQDIPLSHRPNAKADVLNVGYITLSKDMDGLCRLMSISRKSTMEHGCAPHIEEVVEDVMFGKGVTDDMIQFIQKATALGAEHKAEQRCSDTVVPKVSP